jgi:hypothetical protein
MSISIFLSLIALTLCIFCIGLLIFVWRRCRVQGELLSYQAQKVTELIEKNSTLSDEIHEIHSGNKGLIKRVKGLVVQIEQLQFAHQNLIERDPQSRFYNKGVKLISQGASLEEVIRECDMPAAEAELLFNLHNIQR